MAKTIYAVFRVRRDPEAARARIAELYPNEHFDLGGGEWLIVADGGTAREMSERLGFDKEGISNGIVVSASGYFGLAPGNVWEWLASRTGAE